MHLSSNEPWKDINIHSVYFPSYDPILTHLILYISLPII